MGISIEQESRNTGLFMGLIYICLIAISSVRGYFHLVELPWYVVQFSYAAIIVLGVLWVFVTGNMSRINTSLNVMLVQMIPHLLMLVWSVALWVWNREPLSTILRGSSLILYMLLLLSMLVVAGTVFGKKAIEYTALGFILANTLILFDVIRNNGVVETANGLIQFFMSFGSNDNSVSAGFEINDLTFGIGILLAYYLVEGKEEHWRKFYLIVLSFYFILGFKRILFPALAVAVFYVLILKRMPEKLQKKTTILIGLLLIAISLYYVILIKTGVWFNITNQLGIDLMGRKRLYNRLKSYYSISPIYMGIGFGRISKILEVLEVTGNRDLHSDVLRLYIELGMPMSLLWNLTTYVFTFVYFQKKHSLKAGRVYFAIALLMYITFLTDNTIEYYCPQIAWHVLPLAIVLREKEAFAESLLKKKEIPEPERRLQWLK